MRGLVALLRSACDLKCPIGIISESEQDPILLTNYRRYVTSIRQERALVPDRILSHIINAKETLNTKDCLLIPSTEYLNRFFLNNRELLESNRCSIPLVKTSLYQSISDKYSFGELCASNGLAIPEELVDPSPSDIPMVAKPRTYQLADGSVVAPELLVDQQSFIQFEQSKCRDNYYFQKFVDGQSFYLLYYFYRDGKVVTLSQQNLLQQPNGKSIIAAETSHIHTEDICKQYESLLSRLGFFGLIMIELRKRGKTYYTIEANPRLWGPSQLFVDAQRNLFHDFLFDWGATTLEPAHPGDLKTTKYFWLGGLFSPNLPKAKSLISSTTNILNELDKFTAADVYKRNDTINVFQSELGIQ